MDTFDKTGLIFKYMSFNHNSLSLLINKEFWLGPPDKLNDPFEGDFLIKDIEKYHNENFIKKLFKLKRKNIVDDIFYESELNEAINDRYNFANKLYSYVNSIIKSKYGITCFTTNPLNIKMWSHYADSHKGFCLIFNKSEMLSSILSKKHNIHFRKINYQDKLPLVNIVEYEDKINIDDDDSFLFCKLKDWEEEEEVRIILKDYFDLFAIRRLRFDKNCLKGIIFGSRMEYENILTIMNYFESSDQKNKIQYFFARKDLYQSKMYIEIMHQKTRK